MNNPSPTHFIQWSDGQLTPTNEATANNFHRYNLQAKGVPASSELMQAYWKQRPDLFNSTNVDDY